MNKKTLINTTITATLSLVIMNTAHAVKTKEEVKKDSTEFIKNGLERCVGRIRAGYNDCPTSQHSCAGLSDEDGDYEEYIWMPVGTCAKIDGTHLRSVKSKTGKKLIKKMKDKK